MAGVVALIREMSPSPLSAQLQFPMPQPLCISVSVCAEFRIVPLCELTAECISHLPFYVLLNYEEGCIFPFHCKSLISHISPRNTYYGA